MQKTASPAGALCKGVAIGLDFTLASSDRPAWRRTFTKTLLVMKLTVLLLTASFLNVHAKSLAQNVTISGKNLSLKQVFTAIRKQTGFVLLNKKGILSDSKTVSLAVHDLPLRDLLDVVLNDQSLNYVIESKTIFISHKSPVVSSNQSGLLSALPITGAVRSSSGAPLAGASVRVKGKSIFTITDNDGKFGLSINVGDVLVVSYVGFRTKEVTVSNEETIDIILEQANASMDTSFVTYNVGYGTQRLGEITGSIAVIDNVKLAKRAIGTASFDQALGGLAKGVLVADNDGTPGAGANINIRGFTSPFAGGNNQPLFVLDGVILNTDSQFDTGGETMFARSGNPLLAIDPNNIQSISILKDAAATAIYGSRGANGVIIVTTKKGVNGEKAQVNFSFTENIGRPIGQLQTMNTQQFKAFTDLLMSNTAKSINKGEQPTSRLSSFMAAGFANLTFDPVDRKYTYNGLVDSYFGTGTTNWFDEIYRDHAQTQQANLNIRGGTDRTTYSLSGSYYNQQGLMINSNFKQYNFNVGLNTFLRKNLETGVTLNINSNTRKSGSDVNNAVRAQFYSAARPDLPVYDENGDFLRQPSYAYGYEELDANPVAQMQYQFGMNSQNLVGNTFLSFKPIERLKVKASLNVGSFLTKTNEFSPHVVLPLIPFYVIEPSLAVSDALQTNYIAEMTAEYGLTVDRHQFHFIAGQAWDRTNVKRTYNYYQGFPDDRILNNVNNAASSLAWGGGQIESGLNSTFARINYNYSEKYLATANFRSDASSKFGPGNKRGFFPAISLGWVIDKEDFFNKDGSVNLLKFRVSAGKTGSSNISDFAYYQFFEKGFRGLGQYAGVPAVGYSSTLPNPDIAWETTYDYNAGLDFTLKNKWLSGSVDVYYRNTPNSIAATPFSIELGPGSYSSNLIDLTNKGVEIQLDADILHNQNGFNWGAQLNWSFNRNKIKSLNNATIDPSYLDYFIEGQPLGTLKAYKVAGIFQSQAEVDALNAAASAKYGPGSQYDVVGTGVGDYKFADVTGDGRITPEDKVIVGSIEPKYFGGFNNTFSYKGFELSAFFQFVVGNRSNWSNSYARVTPLYNNLAIFAGNTWTEENPTAKYPRVVYGNPGQNTRVNDQQIFDASYFRLKTVYLSYSFKKEALQRINISNATLFVSASNLFTITKWPGTDPGAISSGSVIGRASNGDPYPLAKNISIGLNVQF